MPAESIFSQMWNAYRSIILRSIVTSFGLDFIVRDQTGGDVDTIHNVRETGQFKSAQNEVNYQNRGEYNGIAYHHNDTYDSTIRMAKESHAFFDDAYVPGNRIYYGKASGLGTEHRANLDHVISAHEIHNDKGRSLSGLDGVDLANQPSNLKFTNEHLNKSMGDKSVEEYIKWRAESGNPLPPDVAEQMRKKDSAARQEYEHHISEAYYSSDKFIMDAGRAAMKRGAEMGIRQALGFVFIEIWCACEDELKVLPPKATFKDGTEAIKTGIQKGLINAKKNYKELVSQIEQGFTAGALASLTTTLINIFVTTDKNTVRYIRQGYTIIVQVGNILLNNPEDLLLGDQLKTALVSLTTGASVLAGTFVGNQIEKTPIGKDKHIGAVVQNFCASLVSGLISCTLLIMIDRSKFIGDLVKKMNIYGTVDNEIRGTSAAFIAIAAEIAQYDITGFTTQVEAFQACTKQIIKAKNDEELHDVLLGIFDEYGVPLPWEGDFDTFMGNPENFLVFE